MDNTINNDIIEKVTIKSVAIYKAMSVLPAPPFEDKFVNKKNICQQNEIIQNQNLEKCLNAIEPSKENEITDTTNETKNDYERKSWKDITNPKERQKAYNKAWRETNKESKKAYDKDYREINKEKRKVRQKSYCDANKDKLNSKSKAYNKVNKDKICSYKKAYRETNKEKLKVQKKNWDIINKEKVNIYFKNKKKTDIQFRLSCNLRKRLYHAINRNFKAGSAVRDLGCSISELKSYLESKFSSGMTWDNWALDGWHIDHIKPLSSFDLTNRQQLLEACHYTNLQPLWATDNLIKSDKIL